MAQDRIAKLLAGTIAPENGGTEDVIDIETYARDQITKHIARKFRCHDFARLVDEILRAQGYTTRVSPPGPDGGVDILASSGPLGFDQPRICVQVKSSESPVDVKHAEQNLS